MSVLVEEQVAARRRAERAQRSRRRMREQALRRPPSGVRTVAGTPHLRPTACAVRRSERRWSVLAAIVGGACALVVMLGGALGGMADGVSTEVPPRTMLVTVGAGESLWDVAAAYAPGSDPRAVVQRIVELNGLTDGSVPAGYPLTVPVQP